MIVDPVSEVEDVAEEFWCLECSVLSPVWRLGLGIRLFPFRSKAVGGSGFRVECRQSLVAALNHALNPGLWLRLYGSRVDAWGARRVNAQGLGRVYGLGRGTVGLLSLHWIPHRNPVQPYNGTSLMRNRGT